MAVAGRKVTLWTTGDTPEMVAGGREHGITINGEHIETTDKGDNGWRTFMAEIGLRSVDLAFSGMMEDATLLEASLGDSTALLSGHEIRIEGVGTLAGNFAMQGLELSTPHDNAVELSTNFASSGPVTWTAE